jgi:mRNA interferase MazF
VIVLAQLRTADKVRLVKPLGTVSAKTLTAALTTDKRYSQLRRNVPLA